MGKNIPGTKKVCTVWLEAEVEGNGDKKKMFFCFNCRVPILKYFGRITEIVPGGPPVEPYTEIKCKGSVQREDGQWEECGQYYCFKEHNTNRY